MNKAYSRIQWENEPSINTPLNETNLNRMDLALDTVDTRVVGFDTTKFNTADANTLVASVVLNETTGVLTITKYNGSTSQYDTALEKIAINFDYDPVNKRLVITLEDGTIKYVPLSDLIDEYNFDETSTIAVAETSTNIFEFSVKRGSITANELQTDYLADITEQADIATNKAKDSEAWAVGKRGGVDVPSTDPTYENNSKYYNDIIQTAIDLVTPLISINFTTGNVEFTGSAWTFYIDKTTGQLCWEVVTSS